MTLLDVKEAIRCSGKKYNKLAATAMLNLTHALESGFTYNQSSWLTFRRLCPASFMLLGVIAHPSGNTNREILRRQAHLDHLYRRSVQECKRDLVESGWVREQHMRREARLHDLRVAAGFAKEHEIVRRDPAEAEENYGVEAACTLAQRPPKDPTVSSDVRPLT